MTDKLWKSAERQIAKLIGGERVPITGRIRGSSPDILHPTLSVEVKHRESLPTWVHDAMEQAVASIRGEQVPMVVLHEKGMKYQDCLCVFKLSDIITMANNAKKEEV